MSLEIQKLGLIATALLEVADEQHLTRYVHLSKISKNFFEQRTQCSTQEISVGFKELGIIFVNDLNGTARFNLKKLLAIIDKADAS